MSATGSHHLLFLFVLYVTMATVCGQQAWTAWGPGVRDDPNWSPWENYDNNVVVRTYYGDVRGFSIPWHIDDLNWDQSRPDWEEEYPPWFIRRINCFLGVPYATPPMGRYRFLHPKKPTWGGTWEAKYYRHACPQPLEEIQKDIPDFPRANISEDCLHMNIFAPNITWHSRATLYPVIVWIHSGDFMTGTSQKLPGHVLATREVVVVTFNYRLGALGYLTTNDRYASGNWGMFDQHLALEFVKENIKAFRGDPNMITLAGDGSGAASVGFHLMSPMARNKGFFHQTIMMSGSDLSSFAWVNPYWQPRKYALELGELVNCNTEDTYVMIECLRDNKTLPWQTILNAQEKIKPMDGALGVVWAPTQDAGWYTPMPYFPQTPYDARLIDSFDKLPGLIGINTKDGAKKANETLRGLDSGMAKSEFQEFVTKMLTDWNIQPQYRERVLEAVEFQYTYWPEPDNRTARTQEFIDMLTDMQYGWPMDEVLKRNSQYQPTYMYQFNYQSYSDWVPRWMGPSHHGAVPYVFGFPFLNETILNETELVLRSYYDYEDRNMSDWMMMMWTNFARYSRPTVNETRNITWEPFNFHNLSFLVIDEHSHIWGRYRQNKYSFWKEYFPTIAKQEFYFATPTPAGYEYVISTGSMSAMMILLLCGLSIVIYMLWWGSRKERKKAEMADSEIPLSFFPGGSRAMSRETLSKTPPDQRPSATSTMKTDYKMPQPSGYRMPEPMRQAQHHHQARPYNYPTSAKYPDFQSENYPQSSEKSYAQSSYPSYPQSQRTSYPPSQRSRSITSDADSYPYSEGEFSQRSQQVSQSRSQGSLARSQQGGAGDGYRVPQPRGMAGQGYMEPQRKPTIPQHSVC